MVSTDSNTICCASTDLAQRNMVHSFTVGQRIASRWDDAPLLTWKLIWNMTISIDGVPKQAFELQRVPIL